MVKCYACGESLSSTYHAFYSRTQKVAKVDGQITISVLYELQELQFCSQQCWQKLEPRIVKGLNPVYQPFHMVATCSQCQSPVERTLPHYALYIGELEDVSKPWLASVRVVKDREIAVLCPDCQPPADEGEMAREMRLEEEPAKDDVVAESVRGRYENTVPPRLEWTYIQSGSAQKGPRALERPFTVVAGSSLPHCRTAEGSLTFTLCA
ncbi:DNA-directed RNA polymerase subunit N (RpoN/RPB10)/endogenous inhibitor of DNA gyrase (YacG/DUF329 family) [Paraburkholderia sp. GAS448]|uniref:hypothetical protein n=1 Tax=Paraburkholderia sp. GAS448 TaxID=3035136 RepID=UPI003D202A9C